MPRVLILICWGLFLFVYGLSGPLYRTEALRAKIAQETLAGEWVVPTLYGQPFVTKPPGTYVAIAICSLPLGRVTEETARLPSAIAGLITLLLVFAHLRIIVGSRQAFWISMLLPVSFLWLDKVPSAEIDLLQLAWVTWSLMAFHQAILSEDRGVRSWNWWLISMCCVAGGTLTKWTAPAFYYLTIVPYLLMTGRVCLLWSRNHLLSCLCCGIIVSSWVFLAVNQIGWDTLRQTIGNEAAQRFVPGRNPKAYPWLESLTFPFLVLLANTVASIGVLLTRTKRFRERLNLTESSLALLAHCWIWPNLLFWSLPAQHNVRYLLPIIPAFGLLAGLWWVKMFEHRTAILRYRVLFVLPLVTWIGVKCVFTEIVNPQRVANRNAREIGTELAELTPVGEQLAIDKLKDEGILFYYGRPVIQQRGHDPFEIANWALLIESEWKAMESRPELQLVAQLRDQQGAAIFLVHSQPQKMSACLPVVLPTERPFSPSVR